ncbi:hypothetical protein SASPL_126050 [Salvia splendens]|uniref:Uncharacterized protein n=1 Tax=Salvia splendens TaxID=180675 RepID=A0A8X8XL42_SALSN|nr:hypothetical protein SASPL_126050 [Salvia splendens]
MSRSYDYHSSSYSMDEYLERLNRIQRMPSMIGDCPNYPNVHEVLNKKPTNKDKNKYHQKNQQSPEKKVHFAEIDMQVADAGKHGVEDKSIDVEADGFIKKKHKGFALCKWDTFKVY